MRDEYRFNIHNLYQSLLSGIVIAQLKFATHFKKFAHAHTPKSRKKNHTAQNFWLFFVSARVCAWADFLSFQATAILRPLSNGVSFIIFNITSKIFCLNMTLVSLNLSGLRSAEIPLGISTKLLFNFSLNVCVYSYISLTLKSFWGIVQTSIF